MPARTACGPAPAYLPMKSISLMSDFELNLNSLTKPDARSCPASRMLSAVTSVLRSRTISGARWCSSAGRDRSARRLSRSRFLGAAGRRHRGYLNWDDPRVRPRSAAWPAARRREARGAGRDSQVPEVAQPGQGVLRHRRGSRLLPGDGIGAAGTTTARAATPCRGGTITTASIRSPSGSSGRTTRRAISKHCCASADSPSRCSPAIRVPGAGGRGKGCRAWSTRTFAIWRACATLRSSSFSWRRYRNGSGRRCRFGV